MTIRRIAAAAIIIAVLPGLSSTARAQQFLELNPQPKPERQPQAPSQTLPQPKPTMSDADRNELATLMVKQIEQCWRLDIPNAPTVVPIVRVQLARDGSIIGQPGIINAAPGQLFLAVAESGLRAVQQCAPFQIPAKFDAAYDVWKVMKVRLEPSSTDASRAIRR